LHDLTATRPSSRPSVPRPGQLTNQSGACFRARASCLAFHRVLPKFPSMTSQAALDTLQEELPNLQICFDTQSRYAASMDNMRYSSMPSAVLVPADEEDVERILSIANRFGQPVTCRGAGSATTGATSPVKDGWVLDFSSWQNIHIDSVAHMAYVQPGVSVNRLDEAAREYGLCYPPDPSSRNYATIGGTLATNAGGLRGAKYGVTRDYVLAIEGFTGAGEFVRWGADLKKFASGYNIRDLWIGSEGTLGVITGCVLKLIPRPDCRVTGLALFGDYRACLDCSQTVLQSGMVPSILEFLDEQSVRCTLDFWKRTQPSALDALPGNMASFLKNTENAAALLFELDGSATACQLAQKEINQLLSAHTAMVSFTRDEKEAESLWKLRRSCSQAMFELAPRKLNEDIVVPFHAQHDLLALTLEIRKQYNLATPTFGHAADGNFHVHIMYNAEVPSQAESARHALQQLMEGVVSLGGAITGEHGIGLAKSPFLTLQHSQSEIRIMREIKKVFDPGNILNPHLIFDPVDTMAFPRESVRLKWDH